MPMEVTVEHESGAARIVVAGEVDLATADRLREALRSELSSAQRLLVDLQACTFIDSVGLSVLVEAARNAKLGGEAEIAIVSPSPAVRRLLELTQLDSLIPVFESGAGAREGLASTGTPAE
jgi:anti-anti-sigma factor